MNYTTIIESLEKQKKNLSKEISLTEEQNQLNYLRNQ